jgi:hypothetical protein
VNLVVAIGKRYGLEPYKTYEVPLLSNFGDDDYGNFSSELDHYVAQIVVDDTIRRSRQGVELPTASREKIRDYIRRLRELIDKSDVNDAKKSQMHARLDAFEAALGKKRFSIIELTLITIAFASAPGGFGETYKMVNELMDRITHVVAEAKVAEDETRVLPVIADMPALSPPHGAPSRETSGFTGPPPSRRERRPSASAPAFESGGMDDDIPF